jgi:hypothetical protein
VEAEITALEQERCDSPAGKCNVKRWASVCLGEIGLLVKPEEYQVLAFLPLLQNLAFLLFYGGARVACCQGQWGGKPEVGFT